MVRGWEGGGEAGLLANDRNQSGVATVISHVRQSDEDDRCLQRYLHTEQLLSILYLSVCVMYSSVCCTLCALHITLLYCTLPYLTCVFVCTNSEVAVATSRTRSHDLRQWLQICCKTPISDLLLRPGCRPCYDKEWCGFSIQEHIVMSQIQKNDGFLILKPGSKHIDWMLTTTDSHIIIWLVRGDAKEHLHSMGVPQWPVPDCPDPYPVFSYKPPPSVCKRLAGNVPWSLTLLASWVLHVYFNCNLQLCNLTFFPLFYSFLLFAPWQWVGNENQGHASFCLRSSLGVHFGFNFHSQVNGVEKLALT